MVSYFADLGEGRDDWGEVLAHLEAVKAIQERGGAEAVARTLEQLARWTGETTARA